MLVAVSVAILSVIVIINGEQRINIKSFRVTKTCGQGAGLILNQTSGVTSTIGCGNLCGKEELCLSFVYEPVAMMCALYDDIVTSILPEECGIILGQIVRFRLYISNVVRLIAHCCVRDVHWTFGTFWNVIE